MAESPAVRRIFILAGEASGDNHGAALMAAMKTRDPNVTFAGIGGRHMVAEGLDCLEHADKMAISGFSEVIRHLPFMLSVMRKVIKFIRRWNPERLILIDYPGFNLRLVKRLRSSGLKITYYISPQLWAWKENRIKIIRAGVDQMLVIFPFEVAWFAARGVQAKFVGHPLLWEKPPTISRDDFLAQLGLNGNKPVLALFPGSRQQELDRHLLLFADAGKLVSREVEDLQIILGLAHGLNIDLLTEKLKATTTICRDNPRLALRYADAAIVAAGTATLEGGVWGIPMAVAYRMSRFSWWLSNRLIKVKFGSMVNILADKEIVPEFLQERAQPGPIARAIINFMQNQEAKSVLISELKLVRDSLAEIGGPGRGSASDQAAAAILSEI
ncbi:lipid-A-disaccharide synthase [Candidatus Neomarinimicrobiota bacterium]